jgi:hypothetical protein
VAHHLREILRFTRRNSVSTTWCLQLVPSKCQLLVVASTLGAGDGMRRCETDDPRRVV